MADEFARFHPFVNLIFYIVVLGITMFQMQMVFIAISFVSGLIYHLYLKKMSGLKYLRIVFFVILASSVVNPLFSHKGGTLLFYLFTGNPVTLEAIIYGFAAAVIIGAVLLWFSSFNVIMTEDKLLGGVGSVMPHVATLVTMIFRFVPKLVHHGKQVAEAEKALGKEPEGIKEKLKRQAEIFSITTTWALENSVDTADSMRARGYGTGKRTHYNNYKMHMRDIAVIGWIVILFTMIIIALSRGKVATYYYPYISVRGNIFIYIIYTALCMTPMLINFVEAVRWHKLKSKI